MSDVPSANPWSEPIEKYAEYLTRVREMGAVGHRGGLTATKALLAKCGFKPGQRVLEVGCGSGFTAYTIAKEHGAGVVAMDRLRHMLERTAKRGSKLKENSPAVLQADVRALPFRDEMFDVVVCESVIGFVPEGEQIEAIREFRRVLKPEGLLANNEVCFLSPPPDDFLEALRTAAGTGRWAVAMPADLEGYGSLIRAAGFGDPQVETGDASPRQQVGEQLKMDGLRALKPMFATMFNSELRRLVVDKRVAEAQKLFTEHTGYALFFARRSA